MRCCSQDSNRENRSTKLLAGAWVPALRPAFVKVTITLRLSTEERARLMTPLRSNRLSMVVTVARLKLTAFAMSETVGSFKLPTAWMMTS